jgi:hypothetical protein
MGGLQLSHWDDLMQILKSVLWVEKVFAGSDDLIREEVMAIVMQNAMRVTLEETLPGYLEECPIDGEEN